MVAKISMGSSLYGALAYNGEKINEARGKLLATNKIYNDGTGTVDIGRALNDFLLYMPSQTRVEKPVVHISLNPHPEDRLTDTDLQNIAREYLEKLGFGEQPYMVYKHEDHVHIVTVNVDENGRRLNCDFLFRRSDRIRRELEEKYGLRPAERRCERLENPLHGVDVSAGDVKRQVGNTVKAVCRQYRFQTMGEYRALLSLYNVTVEETQGNVRGREYRGLVYSATDSNGNKVGNPFKSSLFGKTVGYDAVQKKFARSGQDIRDRKLADVTKRTVLAVLGETYDKEKFISRLKEKGIDTVLRHTEEGTYGQGTFRKRLAGTFYPAVCRTPADQAFRSGGRTRGGLYARRFRWCRLSGRHGAVHSRRSGGQCRRGSLYPSHAAQEEKEEAQGLGYVIRFLTVKQFQSNVTTGR